MKFFNNNFRYGWKFSSEPFPAFRAALCFGRNKNATDWLPVDPAVPVVETEEGEIRLVDDNFQVALTTEGKPAVVPGKDDSRRCLLLTSCEGGFRGGVSLLDEGTTARILTVASAGNACDSEIVVAALLDEGQSVVFHATGRRFDRVYVYTWDGDSLESKSCSKEEYDFTTSSTVVEIL